MFRNAYLSSVSKVSKFDSYPGQDGQNFLQRLGSDYLCSEGCPEDPRFSERDQASAFD